MSEYDRVRTPAARRGEADFWPANSLASWGNEPETSFHAWLAQHRVSGTRHFRESSKETYFAMFATWVGFLSDRRMTVLEATSTEASNFFGDKALVPVSRRRYLQLLDKVYQHLTSIGWDLEHPLKGLLRLERELVIALPVGLDTDQLGKLEQVLSVMTGAKAPRDRSLTALMVGAGLRSNEVIQLRCAELQPNFGIEVKSHSVHPEHSTLVLPDGPWRMWLEQWREERCARNVPGDLLCPAASNGKAFTTSGLYRRIDHWFSLAGIEPAQGGANVLRNTFARLALESKRYTVTQVQGFMGHGEIRTTERHLAHASNRRQGRGVINEV